MREPFDLLAPGAPAMVALLAFRLSGMMLVAPLYSGRVVPVPIRVAVLLVLTALLIPVAWGHLDRVPQVSPAALIQEMLIGFAIGLGAAVLIGAAEVAGDYVALQTGLSSAGLLDPVSGGTVPTLGQFTHLFALTTFLTLNGHVLVLEALAASTELIPVGAGIASEDGLTEMILLGGHLFAVGLRIAAPVIVAVLISNLALGILNKAAPQFNVLLMAFPVQIGIGLLVLALTLPLLAAFVSTWPGIYEGLASRLIEALRGS